MVVKDQIDQTGSPFPGYRIDWIRLDQIGSQFGSFDNYIVFNIFFNELNRNLTNEKRPIFQIGTVIL